MNTKRKTKGYGTSDRYDEELMNLMVHVLAQSHLKEGLKRSLGIVLKAAQKDMRQLHYKMVFITMHARELT